MTTAADDRASEGAFEALLAGRPAPEGAAGLAAFTGAVRGAATQPGRPSAALAELLSTGLLTDQSSPSARTAPAAGTPVGPRSRTRRRLTVIVPALIAKLLSAGAVAQAAAGAGVVVVVVAGAGTAGVLPGETQETFSAVTGLGETGEEPAAEVPTGTGSGDPEEEGELANPTDLTPVDEPAIDGEAEEAEETEEFADAEDWAAAGLDVKDQAQFKAWLAIGKAEGWVSGPAVSAAAHARNDARKKARDVVEELEETPEVVSPQPVVPEVDAGGQEGDGTVGSEVSGESEAGGGESKAAGGKGGGKGKGRG